MHVRLASIYCQLSLGLTGHFLSIHQPSAELFQEFDRLLLLQKGGKTVYFGDIGTNATTLIDYFQRSGGYACPPDANP